MGQNDPLDPFKRLRNFPMKFFLNIYKIHDWCEFYKNLLVINQVINWSNLNTPYWSLYGLFRPRRFYNSWKAIKDYLDA